MPLPRPLVPPARIGVIAPASAPRSWERYDAGVQALQRRGFEVVSPAELREPRGYLAATDTERIEELNGMLRRTDIDALICVRGGYGVLRILDQVDFDAARRHPKLLIGYSDITALQWALFSMAGWRSVSGPMVSVEWPDPDPASESLFNDLVSGNGPSELRNPDGSALRSLRPGTVEGMLLGGNLSMIVRLVGTPYLPDLAGAILFIEDVGEPPYRLDGLLAHLRLAGILERLGGVVIGAFTETEVPEGRPTLSVDEVMEDYFGSAACPVVSGLQYGHFRSKVAMPIGVRARLQVDHGSARLVTLDPVVRSI